MSISKHMWKDLTRDLEVAFFNAMEQHGGETLIRSMSVFPVRQTRGKISRHTELLDRLKEWDKALYKRVSDAFDDTAEADVDLSDMVNDAWGEAELSFADSKDSRYNTNWDRGISPEESVQTRMKALLGETSTSAVTESSQDGFKDIGELRYALQTMTWSVPLIQEAIDRHEEDIMNLEAEGPQGKANSAALKLQIAGYKALLDFMKKHRRFAEDV